MVAAIHDVVTRTIVTPNVVTLDAATHHVVTPDAATHDAATRTAITPSASLLRRHSTNHHFLQVGCQVCLHLTLMDLIKYSM